MSEVQLKCLLGVSVKNFLRIQVFDAALVQYGRPVMLKSSILPLFCSSSLLYLRTIIQTIRCPRTRS